MKTKILKVIGILVLLMIVVSTAMADDGAIFRKNISKTPAYETEHAAFAALPVYVPPQSSDGTLLEPILIDFIDVDIDGTAEAEDVVLEYVRPLISFYTDGPVEHIDDPLYGGFPGHGKRDAFAAVSLDDGATWLRTNLSNSADLSSFKIKVDGRQKVPYPGDVGRSFLASDGNQVLAVWVSRYAGGGSPNYAMTDTERGLVADHLAAEGVIVDPAACTDGDLIGTPCLYLEDHFAVAGSQGSSDLADEGLPLVGELPYAAVWAARGVILPPLEAGGLSRIVWFKAERLSSAVRDANRPEAACAKGAGCVITWQEDPEGIRPGEGEGPGEGWSGAIAHHQTDTWYSYISWSDFSLVSGDGTYGTFYGDITDGINIDEWTAANATGRPSAAIPVSIPIRLTDNAMCVATGDKPYCYIDFDNSGTADFCASSVSVTIETPEGPTQDVQMCITEDGRLMRGNTASTRARIGLHEYSSTTPFIFGALDNAAFFSSVDSAWFTMSYEENKGLGECEDDENMANTDICDTADIVDKIDMGKNVWYHTFDMFHPELVSQGLMLNQPAVYPLDWSDASGLLTQDTSLGYNFYEITADPIYEVMAGLESILYQTEISRRPSPITQDWYNAGETGTVAFQLWKQGIIRRGGPADIMGRRFVVDFATFDATVDNPYDYANMECLNLDGTSGWAFTDGLNPRYVKGLCAAAADNASANTILFGDTCGDTTTCQDAFPFNEYFDDVDMSLATDGLAKIWEWQQFGPGYGETITDTALTNLDDASWENPYDVAKGHRGFLNGDMLMVMYAWSPNWMANTVGHDNYNLYNRRSFDGGETWSTTPGSYGGNGTTTCEWMGPAGSDTEYPVCVTYAAGEFEQARNVSQLVGTRETILDPRYTPTPPTITQTSVSTLLPAGFTGGWFADDTRNPSTYFMVYETGDNTTVAVGEAEPLDLFYSRAVNWGDDYQVWADEGEYDSECLPGDLDGTGGIFCNEFDALEGSQFSESGEASVATNPSGRFFYSLWNQVDFGVDGLSEDSDAWFRRVLYWFTPTYTMPVFNFPTGGDYSPTVTITSPLDGANFASTETITFVGTAVDFEDGDLSSSIGWYEGEVVLDTGASYSGVFASGLHTITAKVTDTFGNTASDSVTIVVGNEPPTVNITSPAAGSSFTFGSPIDFTATASDPEGESLIVRWSSSLDGQMGEGDLLGYVGLSVGEHTVTAFVQDSLKSTATSTVLITVTPLPAPELDVTVDPVMPDPASMADTITFTAHVSKEGLPVPGALVSFDITFFKMGLTLTVVTDELGTATATYKVNTKKTGIGDASVIATVTLEGFDPVISEPVTFKIQ